jgi:hypothetical protein
VPLPPATAPSGTFAEVIVWVSSFPRSGNTFLRIVLKQLYGLRPAAPHRILLRYEDLVHDPRSTVASTLAGLMPQLPPQTGGRIPSFVDLQHTDIRFFRRGRTGSHHDELPDHLDDLFWSRPDNAAAMDLLGYAGMQ